MRLLSPVCLLLLLLLLPGCPASEDGGVFCAPGDVQSCYCTDGTEGLQECELDGSAWGCCHCDDSGCGDDDDDSSDPLGVDP